MKVNYKETRLIIIPIPEELVGKWVITTQYGTHGSYDIIVGKEFFDTEKAGKTFKKEKNFSKFYNVQQIVKIDEKTYPILQIEINVFD